MNTNLIKQIALFKSISHAHNYKKMNFNGFFYFFYYIFLINVIINVKYGEKTKKKKQN
jgi:hypothetical protein